MVRQAREIAAEIGKGVRMRNRVRSDGLGWRAWLLILIGAVLLAAAVALTIYGGAVRPAQHEVEQVVANDRFPN